MNDINYIAKIHAHIDSLFAHAPISTELSEIKLEIYQNTVDRYQDLLAGGKDCEGAYVGAIQTIGDVDEILSSLGVKKEECHIPPPASSQNKKHMRRRLLKDRLGTLLWMCMLTLYFIVSFASMAWHVTWIMFLVAVALQNLMCAVIDLVSADKPDVLYLPTKEQRSLLRCVIGTLWLLVLAAYFIISFASMAWHVSWVIFLLGEACEAIVSIIAMYVFTRKK